MANKHGSGSKIVLTRQASDIGPMIGQHSPGNSSSQNRRDESQGRVLTGQTESSKDFVPSERLLRNIGIGETIVYGCHRSVYELAEEVLAAILRPLFSFILLLGLCRLIPIAIVDGVLLGLWMVYALIMLYQLWMECLRYEGEEFALTVNAKGEPHRFIKVIARGDMPPLSLWRVDAYSDVIDKIVMISAQTWWMRFIHISNITMRSITEEMCITGTHVPERLYREFTDLKAKT